MTAASFADDMIGGGGKYAAVFHVAGMPWAVTTSTELVAALNDPGAGTDAQKYARAYRRLLFGKMRVTVLDHYPSDHVQIVPSLDPNLGKQSIKYDESKGLSGGGWSVKFGRDAHGAEYSHFRSGAVSGTYDGLDVMPDPIYDNTVKTGILAEDWDGVVGTIEWGNDTGLLAAVVAATAAGDPTYVWVGSSCLALRDNGIGTPSAWAYPCCLRTPPEKIIVNTLDESSFTISSAPSTSIVGMSATLWLVPMTDNGDIAGLPTAGDLADLDLYTKPVMFRAGPVKPNPTCTPECWKIDCGFWQDFLDVKIPVDVFDGEIRGYHFSRAPSPVDGSITRAHLEIYEWDSSLATPAYVITRIWLCASQGSVYYKNKTALALALNEELQDRTFSDGQVNHFSASYSHLEIGDDTAINGHPTIVNGPLAWILRLGRTGLSGIWGDMLGALHTPQWEVQFQGYPIVNAVSGTFGLSAAMLSHQGWLYPYDNSNGLVEGWDYKLPTGMRYYYQYNWNENPAGGTHFVKLGWDMGIGAPFSDLSDREISYWPLPYHPSEVPRYRLEINSEFDTALVAAEEWISLGDCNSEHYLDGKAESIGDNYIEISPDGTFEESGVTMLQVNSGSTLQTKPMYWGQPLYYWPGLHDVSGGDTFRVRQAVEMSSDSLSDLFRGILGDSSVFSSSFSLPRHSIVYHVTDAYDDGDDMRELIDWDRLDQLAPPSMPGVTFGLHLSVGHNIKSLFFNVLLSLGIRQTWGYSEDKRAWVMSFEMLGVANPVKAMLTGRVFNSSNLQAAKPSGTYGNTWLYHHAHVKFNYSGGKPGIDLTIQNVTGRAMLASGNKTLKFDDKIMRIEGASAQNDHFLSIRQMLRRMNSAHPSTTATGTPTSLATAKVGGDCLLTSDLVYDLYKGARGVTKRAALTTKVNINLNKKNMDIGLDLRLAPGAKGIGPAMYLEAARMTALGGVILCAGISTDPTANNFASKLGGLTDLAHFGCFDWNEATDTVSLRSCSCAKYAITIIDVNTTSWDDAGANRNVFRGRLYGNAADTLELADITNGTCKISIDTDFANFDPGTDKIVYFCEYDNSNLQPCQEVYGWLGDEDGVVTDSAAATSQGMTWS